MIRFTFTKTAGVGYLLKCEELQHASAVKEFDDLPAMAMDAVLRARPGYVGKIELEGMATLHVSNRRSGGYIIHNPPAHYLEKKAP